MSLKNKYKLKIILTKCIVQHNFKYISSIISAIIMKKLLVFNHKKIVI